MTGRLYKYFTVFLFITPLLINAQVIQSVSVTSRHLSSAETEEIAASFKSLKIYPSLTDTVKTRFAGFLSSRGYFHSTVNAELVKLPQGNNYELKIILDEGKQTLIKDFKISGLSGSDSASVYSRLGFLKGTPLVTASLETSINALLAEYENSGYPFASVNISSISFLREEDGYTADIFLLIDKKNYCTIDRIEIEGNSKTSGRLIEKASYIEIKSPYVQKVIEEIPARLNRLRFFEPVENPSFYINSRNEGVLKIKIKEKETNSFDGIIGYVPSSQGSSSGYFTGFVNVGLRNMFGSGRSALLRWQTESAQTQELEIKYAEPWLFYLPFNIDLSLFQRKQDTSYVQRYLEGKLEYMAAENISAGIIISAQSTIPSENSTGTSVYNSSSFITGLSLKYDTRDNFYSPVEGIYFSNVYKYASKRISPLKNSPSSIEGSFSLQKFEVDLSIYYSFFSRQVAALSLHARELRGDNYDESDLYRIGGTNTLRGYREKQFGGNRALWCNFEYRFLFSERSFGFLFLDNGYFLRSADPSKSISELSQFKTGYGLGVNLETGLGVLSVSFALANGDSFKEGKIHFGIINEF